MLVRSTRLLAMLDGLLATRPVPGEITRKRKLREKLAALEQEARPRTTTITPPHAVDPAKAWPPGITLDGQREHRAEQLFDGSKADGEQAV